MSHLGPLMIRLAPALTIPAAGLTVAAVLTACQTSGQKTLSIEQAKKVTAEFQGSSFVPPPRTIEDVLAVLDRERATAAAQRAEWLEVADAEPPAGAATGRLINFYVRRAAARGFLGRIKAQIADLEHALELAQDRRDLRYGAHTALGVAEFHAGNIRLSLEHRRSALALVDPSRSGPVIARNATLALLLAVLGDFSSAEAALARARGLEGEIAFWKFGREHAGSVRALIRGSEAALNMAQGKYPEAENLYREAIRLVVRDIEADVNATGSFGWELKETLRLQEPSYQKLLAASLIPQGRLIEAEVAARSAVESAASYFGRVSTVTAEVLSILGQVLLEQGRAVDAARINREAVAIYREMGVPGYNLFYTRTRAGLAEALAVMGKWPEVIEIYRQIERDLGGDRELFEHVFAGNASWAMAEIAARDPGATVGRLTRALARQAELLGDKHLITTETRGLLAAALTANSDPAQALPMFEQAFSVLASNSRDSTEEGVTQTARNRRIAFILEGYMEALAASGPDDPRSLDRALRVAAVAQGRSVQQAVLSAAARMAVSDPLLSDLVRREQDARKQIAALNGTLANIMSLPPEQRETGGADQVRGRIAELSSARASLAREIETRFPDYAALINPMPPGVAEIQAALAPGEALVATYVGDRASYVWAVPKTGPALFRPVARDRLEVLSRVGRLRRALDPNATTLGDIPDFDVALAHELYRDFLDPVRVSWQGSENLLVVADGPLGQLPMGVLVTEAVSAPSDRQLLFDGYRDVPWLARDHAVTVLPSIASLTALRALPGARPERRPFIGFGDPVFQLASAAPAAGTGASGAGKVGVRGFPVKMRSLVRLRNISSAQLAMLPRLPDTADEIQSIARVMGADPARDVFLGRAASEQQVKTSSLSDYRVVAFATHGLMPGDLDGLAQPALALSAPSAPGDGSDGLLTMEEILSLRLDADWVVLSACNTGTAQGAGAEAVSGLGRAFFYAGTRALLVSNWPVETTSAKVLTTDLFRRQAADPLLSRAEALRQAMLGLIDGPGYVDGEGRTVFSYAHPIFWAPFSLVGDGGGGQTQTSRR